MKTTNLFISALTLFCTLSINAAPEYRGIGCNDKGTRCSFGVPTHQVVRWVKQGSLFNLGEGCMNYKTSIIEKNSLLSSPLQLNFTEFYIYKEADDLYTCEAKIHSESKNQLIEEKNYSSESHRCLKYVDGSNQCVEFKKGCQLEFEQALRDPQVLDAKIEVRNSLIQGTFCKIKAIMISESRSEK